MGRTRAAMLSWITVAQIEQFLAAGHSQRRIADDVHVSRSTVSNVQHGRVPGSKERARREQERARRERPEPLEAGLVRRCGSCGALVEQPCVACRARDGLDRRSVIALLRRVKHGEVLEIELRPHHRARYEKVHDAKRAAEAEATGETIVPPPWDVAKGDLEALEETWGEAPGDAESMERGAMP